MKPDAKRVTMEIATFLFLQSSNSEKLIDDVTSQDTGYTNTRDYD